MRDQENIPPQEEKNHPLGGSTPSQEATPSLLDYYEECDGERVLITHRVVRFSDELGDDAYRIEDSAGNVWVPNDETQLQIQLSLCPEVAVVRICRDESERGEWRG